MDQNVLNKLLQKIIDNKNIFLVVVVFLIFFINAVILFGDFNSKVANYKRSNANKLDKIALVESYNASKNAIAMYKKTLPVSLVGDELVGRIEEFAVRHHVNILAISSKDSRKFDGYSTIEVDLSAHVKDFKDLVAFFNEVETSPLAFKVVSWLTKDINSEEGSFDSDINILVTQINI